MNILKGYIMSVSLPETEQRPLTSNEQRLSILKDDCDSISIYHYRYVPQLGKYLDYKALEYLKDTLKEDYSVISDSLSAGLTVVLTRNGDDAIASLSVCSAKDTFDKSRGIKVALQRLLDYYHKKENNSWDYNPDMFITFKDLPEKSVDCVEEITRFLSNYKPLTSRNINVVLNCDKFIISR